jgi:hypothetical protein
MQLTDNTGSSCFTDNTGESSWTDNEGNVLSCSAEPVLTTKTRGKGKKQQIYSQGPWAYR